MKREWMKSMNNEFESEKFKTWTIIDRDSAEKGTSKVTCKQIFRVGKIGRKSRIVARRFADNNFYGIEEIYAPRGWQVDVRFMLAVGHKNDLEIHQ